MKKVRTQLCLGTAKFDNHNYGFGSSLVPDSPSTLLETANQCQIGWVDTSPRYGKSEFIIGKELRDSHEFCISSKIDCLVPAHHQIASIIHDSVKLSLETLKIEMLDLIYLHQSKIDIIQDTMVQEGLKNVKANGLVRSIGASVYTRDEIDAVIRASVFDWIQIPGNILDTSIIDYVRKKSPGMKIAVRSIFLQGLILNPAKIGPNIPQYKLLKEYIEKIRAIVAKDGLDMEQASVSFIVNEIKPEMVIFGTNVAAHIQRFSDSAKITLNAALVEKLRCFSESSKPWTNPVYWKSQL